MTLSQLLPQARFVIVTTPQPAAQNVAKRAAESALRFDLEIAGVIENMSGFTTPTGERFTIFGEGGGQLLADELDVPLLGKIPLQEALRVGADEGVPLVLEDPDAPGVAGSASRGPRPHRRHAAAAGGASGAVRPAGTGGHGHGTADGAVRRRRLARRPGRCSRGPGRSPGCTPGRYAAGGPGLSSLEPTPSSCSTPRSSG